MSEARPRRQRGRPKGSTRYAQQDALVLAKIADLLITAHATPVAEAIRKVTAPPIDESLIHRLRTKLKAQRTALLAAAAERRRVAATRSLQRPPTGLAAAQFAQDWSRLSACDTLYTRLMELSKLRCPFTENMQRINEGFQLSGLWRSAEAMRRLGVGFNLPALHVQFEAQRKLFEQFRPLSDRWKLR